MGHSIQDYLRKINSSLSPFDCAALAGLALSTLLLAVYLHTERVAARLPVIYRTSGTSQGASSEARPFGSRTGTTYTYSWCSGSKQIKEVNKVYWKSAVAAEASGRTLSKLCQK